jgi:hypothetical protein
MRSFQVSIATASCTLMLSAGVAFANDLHKIVTPPGQTPIGLPASPGQTGSHVLASCGPTPGFFSIGSNPLTGATFKSNTGTNSPFSGASKEYAGNSGNPTVDKGVGSPNSVSQYDNACAQAALHMP